VFALASALFGAGFAPGTGEHSPVLFQALAVTAQRDLGQVIPIVQWTVGASFAAAMIVGLTSCVLLWPSPDGGAHTPPELARRVRLLRTLLYFGTFVLVVVSLRFASELRWADDLLRAWHNGPLDKDDPKLKTLESLFSVSTSGVALTNTLTLAAIYVPAAFVLRRRASALAEEAEDTVPLRAKWLQDHGLTLSFSEQLPRVAALLAPLLAGPIGDIIGKLAK
jgi:hypothetical protein